MKILNRSYIYWIPSILWMALIFALSSRQRISISDELLFNFLIFKSLHVIEYAMLFCFNVFALRKNRASDIYLYAAYLTILFAVSDEIHQMSVPTREGTFRDVLIDSGGVFLGILVINQFRVYLKLK